MIDLSIFMLLFLSVGQKEGLEKCERNFLPQVNSRATRETNMTSTLQLCSLLALLQALEGDRKEQASCSKGCQRIPPDKLLTSK